VDGAGGAIPIRSTVVGPAGPHLRARLTAGTMDAHTRPAQEDTPQADWGTAVSATVHCLTGCAAGEILGMVIATAFGLSDAASIAIAILLAFVFGYGLTIRPLLGAVGARRAVRLAFASDTVSITTMEIVDNLFILVVPGALAAGLADGLFWWSLILSLVIAFLVTVPVNRWLIGRGRGHAAIHAYHH
jgi:hypothetical protein